MIPEEAHSIRMSGLKLSRDSEYHLFIDGECACGAAPKYGTVIPNIWPAPRCERCVEAINIIHGRGEHEQTIERRRNREAQKGAH